MQPNQIRAIPVPAILRNIPDPPQQLFHMGRPLEELLELPRIAIVGSRRATAYGKQVTAKLAEELAEQGVVIISGLALGVDGLAHRGALRAGGPTIAVLPSPLDCIAPASHTGLAQEIIRQGGALISEYEPGSQPYRHNFVARNRLVSGLAQVIAITEAADESGSLRTAEFALDQGREIFAVPGNITSYASVGTNNLIKSGATPLTSVVDVLRTLGIQSELTQPKRALGRTIDEQLLINLLSEGMTDGEQLLEVSGLTVDEFNQALTMLEINGKIYPLGANKWALQ